MEKQNFERERNGAERTTSKKNTNQLEWGDHNKNLSDLNFIDRKPSSLKRQDEITVSANKAVDLSEEEPGRNRKGVREGANKLDS